MNLPEQPFEAFNGLILYEDPEVIHERLKDIVPPKEYKVLERMISISMRDNQPLLVQSKQCKFFLLCNQYMKLLETETVVRFCTLHESLQSLNCSQVFNFDTFESE